MLVTRLHTLAQNAALLRAILAGCAVAAGGGMLAVAWLKLATFGYNALDLGIYHQVLANTAAGRLFAFTIHPHSYLGDHVELLLLPLAAVYRAVPSVATLLVLQTAGLLGGAWMLLRHARTRLPLPYVAVAGVSVLGSFVLHNIALFEFHALAFAVPLALFALLAYERRRRPLFLAALVLLAALREDLGLFGLGFGVLAWIDRRPWQWRVVPALFGLAWFALGMVMTGAFNADTYKFLAYLRWLGDTPQDALFHALTQPWRVALHVLSPQNLLFVAALLLSVAALPLAAPRALVPALPSLLALFVTSTGGNDVALASHYPAVFLPFLWWSAIEGLRRIRANPPRWMVVRFEHPAAAALLLLLAVSVYGFWTMSPLRPAAWVPALGRLRAPETKIAHALVRLVDARASVATSYAFLPALGSRTELYSMHYHYAGHRQLSPLPYALPDSVETVLFDTRDTILYDVQFRNDPRVGTRGDDRLRLFMERFRVVDALDSFLLLRRAEDSGEPLFRENAVLPFQRTLRGAGPMHLVATSADDGVPLPVVRRAVDGTALPFLTLGMTWQVDAPTVSAYHYRLELVDVRGNVVFARDYPMTYGLSPTTDWTPGVPVTFTQHWALPAALRGTYTVRITPFAVDGYLTLDALRSAALRETRRTSLPAIVLGNVSL